MSKFTFNILSQFELHDYEGIVEVVNSYQKDFEDLDMLNLKIQELTAITQAYFETKNYRTALHFGKHTVRAIGLMEDKTSYTSELKLVLLVISACYQLLGYKMKEYVNLIRVHILDNTEVKIEHSIKAIEVNISQKIARIINIFCFAFIAINWLIDPAYRHTFYYLFGVCLFFTYLLIDYLKPAYVARFYIKPIRVIILFFLKGKGFYYFGL